jgi:hypothetical protein
MRIRCHRLRRRRRTARCPALFGTTALVGSTRRRPDAAHRALVQIAGRSVGCEKSGSQWTLRWRKTDSNSRSLREGKGYGEPTPGKHCRLGPEPVSGSALRAVVSDWQRPDEPFAGAGPMVRIRFPPPASLLRTRLSRALPVVAGNIATTHIYDHRKTRPEDSPTFKVNY